MPATDTQSPAGVVRWEEFQKKGPPAASKKLLGQEYQELKFTLHRKLLDKINLEALASIETQRLRNEVRTALTALMDSEQTLLSAVERNQVISEVLDEVFGLGPLEPLLNDPSVSDILVNTHSQVYVERNGCLELTAVTFKDDSHLLRIIDKIVSQVGRRIDESSPMVDARLPDGSRVNAIIPPLAVDGPLVSIRRFGTDKLLPQDLVEKQSMTQGMMELLAAAVKCRLNIIVSGGTGSGKTTLLNALSAFIGSAERVVTIEDAAELQLKQSHLARLENASAQHGRHRDGSPAGAAGQLAPYEAGPHHHRRVPLGRGSRHAAGDEHGPRRFDDHDSRQHATRRDLASRSHGDDGELESELDVHSAADLLGRGPGGADGPVE